MAWNDRFSKAALVDLKAKIMPTDTGEPSSNKVRDWLVGVLIKSIQAVSTEGDRVEVLAWLALVRESLLNDGLSGRAKAAEIYRLSDSKKTAGIVLRSVGASVNNYKNADLPLAVKVALPATLAAAALVGGQGAGVVAFGGAIGVPVLLLVFLGAAGVTSVLESFFSSSSARDYVGVVMAVIVRDEMYRRAKKDLQEAMVASPIEPKAAPMPKAEADLRAALLAMSPDDFERHVMSFFQSAGLLAWVTQRSNDAGVDGFARHAQGLIVVQCKRYAPENKVGRPMVQQFKGVIEENGAWRGYVVTTSAFTAEAIDSANKNERLVLVDAEMLVRWHVDGLMLD